MDGTFHPIDVASWARRDEFEWYSGAGCGYSITAEADITHLDAVRRANGYKLYPLLVSVMAQVVNAHIEYRYVWQDGTVGVYDVMHPMFFDQNADGSARALVAEYRPEIAAQMAEIERVREAYREVAAYRPQGSPPPNTVNISCVPWVAFTDVSFCLQYCATYYPPILTFGKYTRHPDGRVTIPLSVYCNHAVCDGFHAARLITEFQSRGEAL